MFFNTKSADFRGSAEVCHPCLKMQTKLVIFNSIYSGGLPSNGDKAKIRIFYVLRKNIVQTHEITHERDTFNSHVRLHGRDRRSAVSRPTTCPWRRKCEFNYLVHAYECVCGYSRRNNYVQNDYKSR